MSEEIKRHPRWFFGGLAASAAVCVTHPLDLLKVHLQTQVGRQVSIASMTVNIIENQGILALYNGLSAAVCRQLTYSTTRFALYDMSKLHFDMDHFATKVLVATVGGAVGGWTGVPSDVVNVRMQNDIKLPPEKRRNYKHAIDGFIRVYKEEGINQLFRGSTTACSRAVMITVGQLSVYDEIKTQLLRTGYFIDNTVTYFTCSFIAGIAATLLSQPLDVIKTRQMNARPGEFKGILDCVIFTAKEGPFAFFKGILPSSVRIIPNTIIVFIFYEALTNKFGYFK
ncbi:mitochondrial dicarboxylate carrier-like [Diabrotica virgifera virgifera]|uniref:Mitochondrial dicarboxylate carrier n=1 Tax=Diabrotica virgifera virgifera TaxID=50390 RepID=A0ABM5KHQ3_DIAVI|nr:mitochondrial dicarboxylate carrier-like [Diabrotica virgifera virgifera]